MPFHLSTREAEGRHNAHVDRRIAALTDSHASRTPDADAMAAADALAQRRQTAHADHQRRQQQHAQQRHADRLAVAAAKHARHLARQQQRKAERGSAAEPPPLPPCSAAPQRT